MSKGGGGGGAAAVDWLSNLLRCLHTSNNTLPFAILKVPSGRLVLAPFSNVSVTFRAQSKLIEIIIEISNKCKQGSVRSLVITRTLETRTPGIVYTVIYIRIYQYDLEGALNYPNMEMSS